MNPPQQKNQNRPKPESPVRHLHPVQVKPPPSPRFSVSPSTPTFAANRRIAIAVDLSDESAFAVKWSIQNYLRPGDAVILLHVRPTSVLYGADWGSSTPPNTIPPPTSPFNATPTTISTPEREQLEDDFDNFTNTKATNLAQPLAEAQIPFKIHIVKDHDLKERLCLEVERLGLSAVIMGSRGFGASKRNSKGRLGSVSDYCVHHCVCPVVVVRYPEDGGSGGSGSGGNRSEIVKRVQSEGELHPVPEDDQEYHDAADDDHDQKGNFNHQVICKINII